MVSLFPSLVSKPSANINIAGGQALNSKMDRMMEVVPDSIHDRSGIFMGSYDEIEKVKQFHK
jgi:fructose-1,6-bisphosphatase I